MFRMLAIGAVSTVLLFAAGCASVQEETGYVPSYVSDISEMTGAVAIPSYQESDHGKDTSGGRGTGKNDPSSNRDGGGYQSNPPPLDIRKGAGSQRSASAGGWARDCNGLCGGGGGN